MQADTLSKRPSVKRRHARRLTIGYRFAVAIRVLTAAGGGYLLAALSSMVFALSLPFDKGEASTIAAMASYLVFTIVVMAVFAAKTALRACSAVLLLSAFLYVSYVYLQGGNPS